MKWSSLHIWVILGVWVLEASIVNGIDIEKIRSKNTDHKYSVFHKSVPSADVDIDVKIDTLLTDSLNNLFRFERNTINETSANGKRDIKTAPNKIIYNKKKHLMRTIRADEKSHDKRENLLLRLFSDPLKPFEMRPTKKKRDSNGYTRKLEIIANNTKNLPIISQFVLPFPHFAMDRKVNDDKICKTHIFEVFPKQIKKRFETRNEKGNGSHNDISTIDNSNNDWELRQDIFVEEILPFREKSESAYKYGFHDDVRTIFDDMLDLFTMLPSFFDSVVVKMSTEQPKISTKLIDSSVGVDNSNVLTTLLNDNVRNRRQASSESVPTTTKTTAPRITELETNSAYQNVTGLTDVTVANTSTTDTSDTSKVKFITKDEHENVNTSETVYTMFNWESANENTTNLTVGALNTNDIFISSSVIHDANTTEGNKVSNDVKDAVKKSSFKLDDSTDKSFVTNIDTQTPKQIPLDANSNSKANLFELHFADMDRNDDLSMINEEATTKLPSQNSDKSAFLVVLAVIPGLIGLVIAVGIIGIWFIQKNSPWFDRSNAGNDPTTSHSQPKPTVLPCNI